MSLAHKPTLNGRPRLSLPGWRPAPRPEQPRPIPTASEAPGAFSPWLSAAYLERKAGELAAILGVAVEMAPGILTGSVPAPLKVGIREDMAARYPAADPAAIARWLRGWTGTEQYRRQIAAGGARFDLDGNQEGEITDSQMKGVRAGRPRSQK